MQGIFLDIETTGLNFHRHVAIEIACIVVDLKTGQELARFHALMSCTTDEWALRDPQAIQINGFTQEMLEGQKSRKEIGQEIIELLTRLGIQRGTSVFICQNPSFDRSFFSTIVDIDVQEKLKWPYHWLDLASMFWVRSVREWVQPSEIDKGFSVSKDLIAHQLGLAPEEKPHKALNGVVHLLQCYKGVVGFPGKSEL